LNHRRSNRFGMPVASRSTRQQHQSSRGSPQS
jgi:hypothetical protein